jgi:GTP cyclohydrolase IA
MELITIQEAAGLNTGSRNSPVDYDRLLWLARELLFAIGYDPTDPSVVDTPRRWASWWREFIEYEPGSLGTTFEAVSTDQMVAVSGIRVWSLCEHHLLPFWCDLTIAYIAGGKVLGLSKFARIAHQAAHRLQLQERLTHQIADAVEQLTGSPDVAVIGQGEHLCMTMRGIETPAIMTSSVMRGRFRELPALRAELISLTKR